MKRMEPDCPPVPPGRFLSCSGPRRCPKGEPSGCIRDAFTVPKPFQTHLRCATGDTFHGRKTPGHALLSFAHRRLSTRIRASWKPSGAGVEPSGRQSAAALPCRTGPGGWAAESRAQGRAASGGSLPTADVRQLFPRRRAAANAAPAAGWG